MSRQMLKKIASGVMTFAIALTGTPSVIQAQTVTAEVTSLAEVDAPTTALDTAVEDIAVSPDDTPLERQAKLSRSWVVYREMDTSQIWAIDRDGKKHEIQTLSFFTAFNANYLIKLVANGRLADLQTGDPITSADNLDLSTYRKRPRVCRLVKAPAAPAVYLVCNGRKRVILREGVFHRFGWEFRDVEIVPQDKLDVIPTDVSVDDSTVFGEEIEVATTNQRLLRERLTERLRLRAKTLVRDRLVKAIGRSEIFVITADGTRRHIKDLATARALGLNLSETTEVSLDELEAFPEGLDITVQSDASILNQSAR